MLIFFLKLLLVHLLGDFVFHPASWVRDRNKKKHKSLYLYLHALVHLVLLLLVFIDELNTYYPAIIIITASHLLIDFGKIYAEKYLKNTIAVFFIDQLLHLAVIGIVTWCCFSRPEILCVDSSVLAKLLLITIAVLLSTSGGAVFIKLFFQKWSNSEELSEKETLPDAGKYIGILERLMILLFITIHLYSGIGFLLAAKSIFRFGDLTRSTDKKLTEYVLLGTFLSFTIGIGIGVLLQYFISIL